MTTKSGYASRPDLLPESLVRLAKEPGAAATWVGRDGVHLLTLEEHLRVERESLGAFPRRPDGTIDWSQSPDSVVSSTSADSTALAAQLDALTPETDAFVVMWGSLAIPSIRVEAHTGALLATELVSRSTELWIRCEPGPMLVEYSYFNDTLVTAKVPIRGARIPS